jgi:NAD(P)-dependent dehydrogenase (short-subunit alcohol dehydrogenase family)
MLEEMMELDGPTHGLVIVTGAGRGIGAAVAARAARLSGNVLINYAADSAAAEQVAAEIRQAGHHAWTCLADIGTETGVGAVFRAADATGLPLAGLVNNAGISGGFSRLDALPVETLRRVLDVNVVGAMLCAREAVLRMSTKRGGQGGAIVNVSSMAAKLGGAGEWIHYAVSKGAIETLTVGLAREVAAEGIRVNSVSPGLIETDFHATAGRPERTAAMAPSVPMGRPGTAEEVADAIVWLLSREAAYVTGAVVPVAGGR